MKQRTKIDQTQQQKEKMLDRWQKGGAPQTVARLFDRGHSSIQRILAETPGMRPPQRKRPKLALSLAEREEIS